MSVPKNMQARLIVGIFLTILGSVCGGNGQTNTNAVVRMNSPDIFWLKRPLHVAADSMQYIYLPIPGGEGLDQVRNFKYVLDLPEGFELVDGLHLMGHSCCGGNGSVSPSLVKAIASDKNRMCYELGISWIGFTGVSIWLSSPYVPAVPITGTGGQWQDFQGEAPGFDSTRTVWLLRWANNLYQSIQTCRGVVDVDDIVVRQKSNGRVVFEEHFNDGSFGKFKGGQKNGVSLEKENDNYFVRIKTGNAEAEIQQSIAASGTNAPGIQSLIPGEDYTVTCRARAVITRTPDYLSYMPVWIKIGGGKRETEIRAHYEYEIDGKQYSVPEQKLRVIVEDDVKKPKTLEIVLWSQAEDCMGLQPSRVQDYLLDITKSCGIKLHLTELNLNPWKSLYDGKVNKMNLRDPLAEKIKQRGMAAIPYLGFPYTDMGFEAYASNHPPAPGQLAINEIINQFGQTNKSADIRNPALCFTRLAAERSEYWQAILKMLKEGARVNKWDGLMWDYEVPNILCVPDKRKCESCFCTDCIEAFKEYTGIKDITKAPENRVMLEKDYPFQDLAEPARSILSNYPLEWLKFRGEQNGRIWQSMITLVREVNPAARFYLYSGSYQAIPTAEAPWHHCEFYGVYPPAAGRYADVFMEIHSPLRGKGKWGLEEIKLMREALKADSGRKLPVLNTVQAWSPRYPLAKNDAIQSVALTEADGFQIYSWGGIFDSQTWSSVGEGIMALATFEDFFLEGTRFDQVATLDKPLEYSVWIKGEDRVVFIFNNTAKDEKVTLKNDFRVKYASNRVAAKNHATGEVYADPETIVCTAPAYDTTIIHFKAR
ncbi:MAG: hypothetical protein KJ964_08775 [Verrucomicrobia bacterium]|nr:hypothetical protein [Verrucomicrobiota bacterium]MBU1734700.1 hypothetical protein [Verrucomicrobiota bacterium]MBU1856959.1 hypothetical protein [Verrucomicrobiota bacterium]